MDLDSTASFFTDLGIPWPKLNAVMASSTECFGGFLLLIGLGSRIVSVPLAITMSVALLTAHRDEVKNIFQNPDDVLTADPFLFLLASVIVMLFGPGLFSLDALIGRVMKKYIKKEEPGVAPGSVSVEVTRP